MGRPDNNRFSRECPSGNIFVVEKSVLVSFYLKLVSPLIASQAVHPGVGRPRSVSSQDVSACGIDV